MPARTVGPRCGLSIENIIDCHEGIQSVGTVVLQGPHVSRSFLSLLHTATSPNHA